MSASPRTQPTEAHQTHGPGMHNVASPQTTHNDLRTSNDDADNALADARDDAAVLEYGYDFEVKEQDRWLPIANGRFRLLFKHIHVCVCVSMCRVISFTSTILSTTVMR